jgi:NADPH-dependent 2,4-dienoyl-CoA reductase/sulfur reductase-like enzyme
VVGSPALVAVATFSSRRIHLVYAAGDVANHLHPVLGVEHYNSAEHHGAAAALSMLGSAAPFDQYEHIL